MMGRIAVHVDPRLLSEGLLRELSQRSIHVAPLHLPGNRAAVVSEPVEVDADVVVELGDEHRVTIHVEGRVEHRSCRSVDELLALIDEYAP